MRIQNKKQQLRELKSMNITHCYRCGKTAFDLAATVLEEELILTKTYRELEPGNFDGVSNEILEDVLLSLSVGDIDSVSEYYGEDVVDKAMKYEEARGHLDKTWECKKCISTDGYYFIHDNLKTNKIVH